MRFDAENGEVTFEGREIEVLALGLPLEPVVGGEPELSRDIEQTLYTTDYTQPGFIEGRGNLPRRRVESPTLTISPELVQAARSGFERVVSGRGRILARYDRLVGNTDIAKQVIQAFRVHQAEPKA